MNQGRTKDEPKNSQTQKSTFIKIAVSFISLVPALFHRENSERTPKELRLNSPLPPKALFLRLIPKKVDSFPEKVDLFPDMIDCLLKKIVLFLKVLYNQLVL